MPAPSKRSISPRDRKRLSRVKRPPSGKLLVRRRLDPDHPRGCWNGRERRWSRCDTNFSSQAVKAKDLRQLQVDGVNAFPPRIAGFSRGLAIVGAPLALSRTNGQSDRNHFNCNVRGKDQSSSLSKEKAIHRRTSPRRRVEVGRAASKNAVAPSSTAAKYCDLCDFQLSWYELYPDRCKFITWRRRKGRKGVDGQGWGSGRGTPRTESTRTVGTRRPPRNGGNSGTSYTGPK